MRVKIINNVMFESSSEKSLPEKQFYSDVFVQSY
jgi:hypothetical protein